MLENVTRVINDIRFVHIDVEAEVCECVRDTRITVIHTIIYFSKMKSKQGSMVYYIYGFKWHKSRANFRQRWNFKISPHRRHKSFHCIRWCCVTRHGQIWQWYTQSEQFADKIAIRKNSRFERSFLLACLISPTKRSLPSSRPTPRIYEKKKKKKNHCWISNANENSRLLSRCSREHRHLLDPWCAPYILPSFFVDIRNLFSIHKVEKKSISRRMFTRFVDIRLRTIVLTSNFTTSLNISNLRPFFPPLFPFIYLIFRNRKSHAFTSRQYFLLLLILTLIIFTSLSIRRRIDILSIFFPARQDQFLISVEPPSRSTKLYWQTSSMSRSMSRARLTSVRIAKSLRSPVWCVAKSPGSCVCVCALAYACTKCAGYLEPGRSNLPV